MRQERLRNVIGQACEDRRVDRHSETYYQCDGTYFLYYFPWCNQVNIRCFKCMGSPKASKGPIAHAIVTTELLGIGHIDITREQVDQIRDDASERSSEAYRNHLTVC